MRDSGIAPEHLPTIEFGDEAGKIPEIPGRILRDNCGCHQLDEDEQDTLLGLADRPGPVFFNTWEQVQDMATSKEMMWERIETRVTRDSFPMPPAACLRILDVDLQILEDWLNKCAPDGADNPVQCPEDGTGTGSGTSTGTGTTGG